MSIWIDSSERLRLQIGSFAFQSFEGWGLMLVYGISLGAGLVLAGMTLATIRQISTARAGTSTPAREP